MVSTSSINRSRFRILISFFSSVLAGVLRRTLKPTLAFTFAITTPIGIAIGMTAFGHGKSDGGTSSPPLFS